MKMPMTKLQKKKMHALLANKQPTDKQALLEMMQDQKQGEVGDPEHDEQKTPAWMMMKPMAAKLPR